MKVLPSFKPPQQHSCCSTACPSRVLHQSGMVVCRSHFNANRSSSDPSTSQHSAKSRRDALLAIGTALSSLVLTGRAHSNEEDLRAQTGGDVGGAGNVTSTSSSFPEEFKSLTDGFLAYTFKYPSTINGKPTNIIFSRKPERYSSAAPLTPDARQRIVAELVSFPDGVTISVACMMAELVIPSGKLTSSVSVGPPSNALKSKPVDQWGAREVADTVLQDRSTARVTTGQRVSLNSVESATQETRDGQTYWVYEHISQGSPSALTSSKETYRHAWSVTSSRPALDKSPYLYTLTLSCPDEKWPMLGPIYETCQKSFRITPPTKDYVPPDKDPWRFF